MVVEIKGVIGIDVTAAMVKYQLNREKEDLVIELDSPGGFISDSITIFNDIAKYNKGSKTINVTGQAASAASYIMFSGDNIKLAHNSSVFIHPPQGGVCGDYRDVFSYGEYLKNLTDMFISEYSRYMQVSIDEATNIIESGTWYIGKEKLALLGEVYDSKNPQSLDDNAIQHQAKESMTRMQARMTNELLMQDLKQCAEMFAGYTKPTGPQMISTKVCKQINNTEEKMDKTELMTKHPEVYQAVMQEGYEKGKTEELKRVQAHMRMMSFAPEVAKKAIDEGASFMSEDLQAQYMEARFNAQMILDKSSDNPPPVSPGEPINLQADGGKKTPEMLKKEAEMKEKEALKTALASYGKVLPTKTEGGANG